MAGSFSNYFELEVLKWLCGQTNALGTAPTPYLALFTAQTEASQTEVSGGSYARVSASGKFAAPAAGAVANNASIAFAAASASWGTVTGFGIYDASTGGNLLAWGDLSASKTVGSGDTVSFASGALSLTLD